MQRKKTAIITARMTPEDKQKIEQRAANAGMTVTDYLTACALGKKIVRVDGLDKILAELKAQGRNLNQLTILANMERLTTWTENQKHITFTCPDGRRCRDSSLHDETFLKENMEAIFACRQIVGFRSEYSEPAIGWIGEASQGLLQLGKQLGQDADLPPLPAPPVWTDSKLRRREALIRLAHGQMLSHDSHSQSQSMMGY